MDSKYGHSPQRSEVFSINAPHPLIFSEQKLRIYHLTFCQIQLRGTGILLGSARHGRSVRLARFTPLSHRPLNQHMKARDASGTDRPDSKNEGATQNGWWWWWDVLDRGCAGRVLFLGISQVFIRKSSNQHSTMNQLVSCCEGYTLLGLNDTVFLVCCRSNQVVELMHQPGASSSSEPQQLEGEGTSNTKGDDDDENKQKTEEELKTIHAVASVLISSGADASSSVLCCAVSRGDKSLSIYKLDIGQSELATQVLPTMVYNTPKRLSCMIFTSLPIKEAKEETTTSIAKQPTMILVGGDLAGDAHAYSLDEQCKRQRLLLGHTASMLTGLCISRNSLLSSDRDEKIRISSFPQTYIIEGFLLGHEAYITGIDSTTSGLVATSGGDCTIRLWNLETQLQVFELSTRSNEESGSENGNTNDLIPTDLRFTADGSLLAVVFDQSNQLDVYRVAGTLESSPKLELVQRVNCASPLLGVQSRGTDCFYVLQRDPAFIACYRFSDDGKLEEVKSEDLQLLVTAATERKIVMPNSILERDKYGQIKLKKLHETRGPSAGDEPWNRVERVEIAKAANKRHKRRRREGKQE